MKGGSDIGAPDRDMKGMNVSKEVKSLKNSVLLPILMHGFNLDVD